MYKLFTICLERIPNSEVHAHSIERRGNIKVRIDRLCLIRRPVFLVVAIGLIRRMDCYADIESNHQAIQVQSQTRTSS